MAALLLLGIVAAVFLIGTLPLHIAVRILGGDVSFLKVILVKVAAAVVAGILTNFLGIIGALIAGIATLFIYKLIFDLSLIRAIIAWVIETLVMIGLVVVVVLLGFVSIAALGM
ncbi:hypothetical protein JW898_01895 [Candidatus Woesearchaeota archaeon]|nr:hypothetical protein [Candidatus Woesearchaeota archaeon]